jgi:hypothetical protein
MTLEPGDRCYCGLVVGYGEIFHKESPAHFKALIKKREEKPLLLSDIFIWLSDEDNLEAFLDDFSYGSWDEWDCGLPRLLEDFGIPEILVAVRSARYSALAREKHQGVPTPS